MIETALIDALAAQLERQGLSEASVAALRRAHPGLHITLCSDDDVPARLAPAVARPGLRVYLVDAGGHCVRFVTDQGAASGLVFASTE